MKKLFMMLMFAALGYAVLVKWDFRESHVQSLVAELNRDLPRDVTPDVRFETATVAGKEITVVTRLKTVQSHRMDHSKIPEYMATTKINLKREFCKNRSMKIGLENGVSVIYSIRTQDDARLGDISITINDC